MKKRTILIGMIISALFCIITLFHFLNTNPSEVDQISSASPSIKNKETSAGFAEYEFMRLRDPETGKIPLGIERHQIEFAKMLSNAESRRLDKRNETNTINFKWRSRGPYNIGGRVRGFGLDIRDENIIVAGGVSGGIWKSIDNGRTWRKTTKPYELHSVSCLVQDHRPGKEDIWYYGSGEYIGGHDYARGNVPYRGDGIYKSYDNGDSWELLESTSIVNAQISDYAFSWVWKVAIDNSNLIEDELYAAAFGGIYKSQNGGLNWYRVLNSSAYSDVLVTSTGIVYAAISFGPYQGIYRSEDGEIWTQITPSAWPSYYNRIVMALAPSNENVMYFFTETTRDWSSAVTNPTFSFWKYTTTSGDGTGIGAIWEDRSSFIPKVYSGKGYAITLKVHPEDENMVFIGMQSLYRSGDGFKTAYKIKRIGRLEQTFWEQEQFHCDVHWIEFSQNDPNVAYVAHDGSLSKTSDITSQIVLWQTLECGLITAQFYTSAIAPDLANDPRILGCMHDNGVYHLNGFDYTKHWKYLMWGDGAFAAFVNDNKKFIVSWQNGNMYISKKIPFNPDDWSFWTRINPQINDPLFIVPFHVDPNNDNTIYLAAGYKLMRCFDINTIPQSGSLNEKTNYWQTITTTPSKVTAIGISKEPANVVYIGTQQGSIFRFDNSLDENSLRVNVTPGGKFPSYAYTSNIAVDPHDADHVVITFSNYNVKSIYATWDRGTSWEHVSGNLEEYPTGQGNGPAVNWVAILPQNGSNTYFVGTTTGLYSTNSLDGENTVWAKEGATTIGNVIVKHIVTREVDGEVVVSTYGNGVFSRDFSTSDVHDQDEVPKSFTLFQNYPNPFNSSTEIKFEIHKKTSISLKIYNYMGQEIKTLFEGFKNKGAYQLTWDGSNSEGDNVSSGIYFVKLKNDRTIKTIKILLIQ